MANENGWRKLMLQEAGVKLIDCVHKTPPAAESGYAYVAIPQMKGGRVELNGVRRISEEHFNDWTQKALPQANDVILSRRCNPGETAWVNPGLECALGQNLVLLRADGTNVFPPFLRWLVRGPNWWQQVGAFINVGAVFDSLKCADIPNFSLPLPPLPEQKAIANILGTLDDKIELNRRMNETLESLARAIFKSWFVDFDPVRAKMDGRKPAGMDEATAALFPDKLEHVNGELIPAAWTTSSIGNYATNYDSRRVPVKQKDRKRGPYPYYGASGIVDHVSDFLFDGEYLLVAEDGENLRTRKTPVAFRATGKFWVNNHAHILKGPTHGATRFLLLMFERSDISGYLTGSTIPKLSQRSMNAIDFLLPADKVLDAFGSVTDAIFQRIDLNRKSNVTLVALRDTLVPRLLSGKLRVADAERVLKEVV